MVYQIHRDWLTDTRSLPNDKHSRTISSTAKKVNAGPSTSNSTVSNGEMTQTKTSATTELDSVISDANLNFAHDWLQALEPGALFINELSVKYSQTCGWPELAHSVPVDLLAPTITSNNARAMISTGNAEGSDRHISATLLSPIPTPSSSNSQADVTPATPLDVDTAASVMARSRQIRRREQNRKSQQAFRQRKEEKLVRLKSEVEQLRDTLEGFQKNDSSSAGIREIAAPIRTVKPAGTVLNCHFCGAATAVHAARKPHDEYEEQGIVCGDYGQQEEFPLQACEEWWQYFISQGAES